MWRYVAASVQGTSHQRNNTPCQDYSTAIELSGASLLLLVCSDGAGSGSRSEVGSEVACRTLVDEVTEFARLGGRIENVTRETAVEWLEAIRTKLDTQASALGLSPRDLACTLIAALIASDAAAFIQVGDGAVVTVSADNNYRVVFWPDQGEYANTTYFVTGPDAADRLRVNICSEPVKDVALFTDGLQHVALRYESKTPHRPFFAPMFARLRSEEHWQSLRDPLIGFLGSEAVSKRTDDDRTLVLASNCES
jgi:protein phosphatase 2C-like protein